MIKPELLAPAGDFDCLRAAVSFGADAVYLGGSAFTMRSSPANFDKDQLIEAVKYAHRHGVKVHLTCNTLPRNDELSELPEFLKSAQYAGVDAFIICDLGVMQMAKKYAPNVEIHASTQTGVVNFATANYLHSMGLKRVVLSRELSLDEIKTIRDNTPRTLEIETFVHGAMCVSFSGRCLLSNYLTGRDANRGRCAQPCRWSYTLCESKRPGEHFPVFEDDKGTHILNARDLCMIEHIPELVDAGISSFKIEGRAKSAYYVAVVTNAYRIAIDRFAKEGPDYKFDKALLDEVNKVSHRDYCTGFYYGPIEKGQIYEGDTYIRNWDIVAQVVENDGAYTVATVRNPIEAPGTYEAVEPGKVGRVITVKSMFDENGKKIERAAHPEMTVNLEIDPPLAPNSIIRKTAEA